MLGTAARSSIVVDDRPLQPGRAELRQEDRDAERDRDADRRGRSGPTSGCRRWRPRRRIWSRPTSQTLDVRSRSRIRGRPASRRRSSSRGCRPGRAAPGAREPKLARRNRRSKVGFGGPADGACCTARRSSCGQEPPSADPSSPQIRRPSVSHLEERLAGLSLISLPRSPGLASLTFVGQRHVVELARQSGRRS